MSVITKSLTAFIGLSICGMSGYLLYLFLQKDEDEDLVDVYSQAFKFKTREIKVPKDAVPALIGRNGDNIKLIQEQSNAKINFKDRQACDEKICVIRGSIEACNIAENLIYDFIDSQPVIESQKIFVATTHMPKLIGRGGEKVKEIRSLSGAKISCEFGFPGSRDSEVVIQGSREQIIVAISLIEDVVAQTKQFQENLDTTLSKREPRLPPKSPNSRQIERTQVERLSPVPGQSQDAPFEVYVSAMIDPSRFWIQIVGTKATELDCLVDEMTDYYNNPENQKLHVLKNINIGDSVAAIFQFDNKWYRAEVVNIFEQNSERYAQLIYGDYGDLDTLHCSSLFELRTDFLRLHFQAIECFLARVEPIGEEWPVEAIDKFEEFTHVAQWKKLSARVNGYSVREKIRAKRESSPVPGVDLFEINNEQDIDIAEELVKSGLAVFIDPTDARTGSRTTSISNLSIASNS